MKTPKSIIYYLVILILFIFETVSGQVKPRVVDLGKQYDNQPFKVLGCQIGQLSFADCTRIEADSDWWQNIKFIVKNVSSKTITYYSTTFLIPKQGNMQSMFGVNLALDGGPVALVDDSGKPAGKHGIRIKPSDVVMFKPYEYEVKHWRDTMHLKDVDDLDKISLRMEGFYFIDGTTWFFGREGKIHAGQTDDLSRKLITYSDYTKVHPITISQLDVNGRSVKPNEPFTTTDPDWVKDLKITFQNNTDRTIKGVAFYFTLYEGHPVSPPIGLPVTYGRTYEGAENKSIVGNLEPGKAESIFLEKRFYDSLRSYNPVWMDMAKQTTGDIRLSEIVFTDGVKWSSGCFHQPDPERQNQWLIDCVK